MTIVQRQTIRVFLRVVTGIACSLIIATTTISTIAHYDPRGCAYEGDIYSPGACILSVCDPEADPEEVQVCREEGGSFYWTACGECE